MKNLLENIKRIKSMMDIPEIDENDNLEIDETEISEEGEEATTSTTTSTTSQNAGSPTTWASIVGSQLKRGKGNPITSAPRADDTARGAGNQLK
jgi:hypothetical protein